MALSHAPIGLASSLFLAVSLLFLFFVILSAVSHHAPFKNTYFLQADTSGMTGARSVTQWAYFYICGQGNKDCSHAHAAPALGSAWDRHASGVPSSLAGSHGGGTTSFYYYYMWRFSWVFYIIALFFEAVAFFSSFLSCCGRLGAGVASLVTLTALFFLTIAVSLMTATFVRARNVFHANGHSAKLGKYAFGFSWAAWAALLISLVLLCLGTRKTTSKTRGTGTGGPAGTVNGHHDEMGIAPPPQGRRMRRGFGRKNNRPNGSFSKSAYEDGQLGSVSSA